MRLPPRTTPAPQPVLMPGLSYQAEAPAPATATPLSASTSEPPAPTTPANDNTQFTLPRLRLQIHNLSHPGAGIFLRATSDASAVLESSVRNVLKWLYSTPQHSHAPPTRSVTLILRDMDGVAYTTGSDLDDDHKEIHFSLGYISGIRPAERQAAEVAGVITHELVHCYQWNGRGGAPGGLIEGVADWVRLRCDLAPPHWRREAKGSWDGGYQHTAYFLEYLEGRFGEGTVLRINEKLRTVRYKEKPFWTELLGRSVEQLWEDYKEKMKADGLLPDEIPSSNG